MKKIILCLFVTCSLFIVGCSNDDNSSSTNEPILQDYQIDFITGELEPWVSISAEVALTYQDDSEETTYGVYNNDTNVLSVIIPSNTRKFKIDFWLEDSSAFTMKFYGVENNEMIHEQDVNNVLHFTYEYEFE